MTVSKAGQHLHRWTSSSDLRPSSSSLSSSPSTWTCSSSRCRTSLSCHHCHHCAKWQNTTTNTNMQMQKQVQNILVMPLLPSVHSTISLTLTSDPIKWRVCGYFEAPLVWTASGYAVHNHTIYHIHICHFLHRQNFWWIKFTPKFTQKIANLHSTLPIFRVKSVKIYTGQFFLHRHRLWCTVGGNNHTWEK